MDNYSSNSASGLQRGFSLIELMIALTLGLIILTALGSMLVNQIRLRAELDRSSRLISNGTYAISMLADSVKLAGFYDAFDPTSLALPTAMPDPCDLNVSNMQSALRLHVQGYDAATPTSIVASPPCVAASALKAGSDILVIRRADTSVALDTTAAVAGTHYLQASLCPLDSDSYRLDNRVANFSLRQKNCTASSTTPYALVRPFHVEIYYVDGNDKPGDGIPTLKKVVLRDGAFTSAIPLVEGIEFLQIEYGLDTNNDGVAETYSSCGACSIGDWASVVTVKLHVISKSVDESRDQVADKVISLGDAGTVGPFNDRFKRASFHETVRLVNPSSRRELP